MGLQAVTFESTFMEWVGESGRTGRVSGSVGGCESGQIQASHLPKHCSRNKWFVCVHISAYLQFNTDTEQNASHWSNSFRK